MSHPMRFIHTDKFPTRCNDNCYIPRHARNNQLRKRLRKGGNLKTHNCLSNIHTETCQSVIYLTSNIEDILRCRFRITFI